MQTNLTTQGLARVVRNITSGALGNAGALQNAQAGLEANDDAMRQLDRLEARLRHPSRPDRTDALRHHQALPDIVA